MVDLATRVMVGEKLLDLGYGEGLYKTPPYFAVKVPVFSFEKLNDVNSALGPEMKSTGEVLGIGRSLEEALLKGLIAAGFKVERTQQSHQGGIYITVSDEDKFEIIQLAKKLSDLGLSIYATKGTAAVISQLGIDVSVVNRLNDSDELLELIDNGFIDYIVFTGADRNNSLADYIRLHRHALLRGVSCLTSLDTANALADIIASRFNQQNTELVDIGHMRAEHMSLHFTKMQGSGNDGILFDNFDGKITAPEALAITACDRHYGVGGDSIVLIEKSVIADAKMRVFNQDGSEGQMAGNLIRCVAKYLRDNGFVNKDEMAIETLAGVRDLTLYTIGGRVKSVKVDMGEAHLAPAEIPVKLPGSQIINHPVIVGGKRYRITCVSMGNPHCVVFSDHVDNVDVETIGPMFEHNDLFPERVNTEFIRVVNPRTIKMRVWERGNGETLACGTGACAAVVAATLNGLCEVNTDVVVKVRGGDLVVRYDGKRVWLTGNADRIYEGTLRY